MKNKNMLLNEMDTSIKLTNDDKKESVEPITNNQ